MDPPGKKEAKNEHKEHIGENGEEGKEEEEDLLLEEDEGPHQAAAVITEEDEVNLGGNQVDYQKEYEREFGSEDRQEELEELEQEEDFGEGEGRELGGELEREAEGEGEGEEYGAGDENLDELEPQQQQPLEDDKSEDADLPCVVLEYDSQFFVLFGDSESINPDDIVFRGDKKAFGATIAEFIRSLKQAFEITTDVTLEVPQLKLAFPQDLTHSKVVRFSTLIQFHEAHHNFTKGPNEVLPPLKIALFAHEHTFVKQYNMLWNIYKKGGRREDPIVLSDDEEESPSEKSANPPKEGVISLDDDSQDAFEDPSGKRKGAAEESSPNKRQKQDLVESEGKSVASEGEED